MFTLNFYTNSSIWFGNLSGMDWGGDIVSTSPEFSVSGYSHRQPKDVVKLAYDLYLYASDDSGNGARFPLYGQWKAKQAYKTADSLHRLGCSAIVAWVYSLINRGL